MVRMKSRRKPFVAVVNECRWSARLLQVGEQRNGFCVARRSNEPWNQLPMSIGLGLVAPPTALLPLPKLTPNWVPMSRAKVLVEATTRASISTSGVLRSSILISSSTLGSTRECLQ